MNETINRLRSMSKTGVFFTTAFIIIMVAVIAIGFALMITVTFNLYPNAAASITGIENATNGLALAESGFFIICAAVALVILYYVRRILIKINENNTPFTDEIVRSLTIITMTISLCGIAAAIISILSPSAFSTLTEMIPFSSMLVLFIVSLSMLLAFLTSIFKYGTELQKESDETL